MTRKKVSLPDIRFDPADTPQTLARKLNLAMAHVRALTQEVNRLTQMLEDGETGQVLTKVSDADYAASWQDP